jgi:hypothetical protein
LSCLFFGHILRTFRLVTTSTAHALLIEQNTGEYSAQPLAATKKERNNLQRMRK